MPHLFVNRPRHHDVFHEEPGLRDQFVWETINAIVYKLGGILFVAGSVFFFPALAAYVDLGVWAFIVGSLLYLLVTAHDMLEARHYARKRNRYASFWDKLEISAAASYLLGSILFTVGSVFFLSEVGFYMAAGWCFVVGSLLFIAGAIVNLLQIVQARDLITLQLMNLTAVTFVTGSVLFTVASVPYLWHLEDARDRTLIDAFDAWQYLFGSVLFLLGGVFNYWRACLVMQSQLAEIGRGKSEF